MLRLPDCNEEGIVGGFAMASQRYFRSLEGTPVFSIQKFFSV
jgi:hypothetical protein